MSTYTGVTNCQKQSAFLAHPVDISRLIGKPLIYKILLIEYASRTFKMYSTLFNIYYSYTVSRFQPTLQTQPLQSEMCAQSDPPLRKTPSSTDFRL